MELFNFLKHAMTVSGRGITFSENFYIRRNHVDQVRAKIPWELWWKYADLTHLIDYGCAFDGSTCALQRRYKKEIDTVAKNNRMRTHYPTIMCCCEDCLSTVGHAVCLPKDMKILSRIARYFNSKTGFWRPYGCALPRRYRADICLTFSCKLLPDNSEKALIRVLAGTNKCGIPSPEQIRQTLKADVKNHNI